MLLVVGGHSRKTGKTSVVVGLIRALRGARWTAVKITAHASSASESVRRFTLREETEAGAGDSGRYLEAGAVRSFWLDLGRDRWEEALQVLRPILEASDNAIVESTGLVRYLRPDRLLFVVDPWVADWKQTAREQWKRADGFVIVEREVEVSKPGTPLGTLPAGKPKFDVRGPEFVTVELIRWVTRALGGGPDQLISGKAINSDIPPLSPR